MRVRANQIVLLFLGLLLTAGCGGPAGRPTVYKAGGIIKMGGNPVADASVQFAPATGRPATGKTDAKGEFKLTTYNTDDGAVLGTHSVTITAPLPPEIVSNTPGELQAIEKATSIVPAKYGDQKTSGLTNTVEKDGKNYFEINLTP